MKSDNCLSFLVFQKQLLVDSATQLPLLLTHSQLLAIKKSIACDFFVGTYQSMHYRVIDLTSLETIDEPHLLLNPRKLLGQLDETIWQAISRGLQLVEWYYAHQFCSRCGNQTSKHPTEYALECSACHHAHYPRINPCIMVLIANGDKILLAKSSRSNISHYSLVAGFVEAGENVEEAVHREVYEEVGLQIGSLKYVCSQSWPFPHSLMLGFSSQYLDGQLCLDHEEIAEAQWFARNDIGHLKLPDKGTLSRKLIDTWFE